MDQTQTRTLRPAGLDPRVPVRKAFNVEIFDFVLILLACVIASTVVGQIVHRISLPLVQIAVGVVVALIAPSVLETHIPSELFLVLFIAPLLFNDARHANRQDLWRNKGSIFSLAVGLVLLTVLVVGFVLNLITPSIPLAAAFAVGAALGPTDAAAVAAMGANVDLKARQRTLLSGESLINDASGVVSFQFAIAAAVTGTFSLAEAGRSFLLLFFGGIALGLVLGLTAQWSMNFLRRRGFENTTVHVLYEVFTPFMVFLAGEALGVSGILAVVAAGLAMADSGGLRLTSISDARHQMVSDQFWRIMIFLINGIIFVMLGMQLPQAFMPALTDNFSPPMLIGLVLLITVLVMGCRFLWLIVLELCYKDPETGKRGFRTMGQTMRDTLIMTFAGPKGAVTLSIIFTIPFELADGSAFPDRDLLVFLTASVILCTLLAAELVLPRLAPSPAPKIDESDEAVRRATIQVLEATAKDLKMRIDSGTQPEYEPALRLTLARYNARLARERRALDGCKETMQELFEEVMELQQKRADELQKRGVNRYGPGTAAPYYAMLRSIRSSLGYSGRDVRVGSRFPSLLGKLAVALQRTRSDGTVGNDDEEMVYYDTCLFAIELEHVALDYLSDVAEEGGPRADAARALAAERQAAVDSLWGRINYGQDVPQPTDGSLELYRHDQMPEGMRKTFGEQFRQAKRFADEVDANTLILELDEIRQLQEEGKLSEPMAKLLREKVYVLQMDLGS